MRYQNYKEDLFKDLKLNYEWGYGRFDFIKKEMGMEILCSLVGVPPVGIHPCNFQPCFADSSEEQLANHRLAKEAVGGCDE